MGSLDTLIKKKATYEASPACEESPKDRNGELERKSVPLDRVFNKN